jgi:16S rRNA (cytidine1402-2'-O)-methyltransferase
MPGTLFVVATPIGNLNDVTARALRVLREVAVIAAEDTRRTRGLLARYGIPTPTTSFHEHSEVKKAPVLIARLQQGDDVALVSDAGMPVVSDPGQHLIRRAHAAGIRVVPIPGPSAAIAALAASGFPADTFLFMGFPPIRSKDRKKWLDTVASAGRTTVFFEAPHRIQSTLESIHAVLGECQILVAREITKIHENLVVQPISAAITSTAPARGEYTVVLDLGRRPDYFLVEPAPTENLAQEFALMTKSAGLTRRQALAQLGRKYGLTANTVYAAVEKAKKSGE